MSLNYIWDSNKAADNNRKHKLTFEEAITVFDDTNYDEVYDEEHSIDEHRYKVVGFTNTQNEGKKKRKIQLVYTFIEPDTCRIITAWPI